MANYDRESTLSKGNKAFSNRSPYSLTKEERNALRDQAILLAMAEKDNALSILGNHESYLGYLDQLDRQALENWR